MSIATFPAIKDWYSAMRIPTFDTLVVNYGNAVEQRLAKNSTVRYKFQLQWGALSDFDEARQIEDFFILMKGNLTAFFFVCMPEAYGGSIWAAEQEYSFGNIVRPPIPNGHSYICTEPGTSSSSEPLWPTISRDTVVDGEVTWEENSYCVRFADDLLNFEYFCYALYKLQQVNLIQVAECEEQGE